MTNRIRQIGALGQAVWLDFISRELLVSGKLAALVDAGVCGVTSNPTIFQKSVAAGSCAALYLLSDQRSLGFRAGQ